MSGGAAVVGVLRARGRSASVCISPPVPSGYALLSRNEAIEEEEEENVEEEDDLQQLEDRLGKLRAREIEVKAEVGRVVNRLIETQKYWSLKQETLDKESESVSQEIVEIEEKIQTLKYPGMYAEEQPPPGPKCFSFVRSQPFLLASACVIVANIYTMVLELMHPSYKRDFFVLDQLFLAFYVMELCVKAMYYRERLLWGRFSDSWWNWLDLLIVVTGLLDQWVAPLLLHFRVLPASVMKTTWAVCFIRLLRLARLPRILKIVHVFLKSDFSWATGDRFQLFMMGVISFNCIVMSFEADMPDFVLWPYVENLLMAIFMFELMVRLRFAGCNFFCEHEELAWNWLDFIIVMGGVIETWLMPCIGVVQALLGMEPTPKSHIGQVLIMFRMARLLRILRLVRLIKNIPPLFTLLLGIVQAMYGMIWVLVLTAVLLYSSALLCVKLIGQGLIMNVPEDVAVVFPNVPQSMFVLFMAMNGNAEMLTPLFHAFPISKFVFVIYMVVLSWGILSILTAVVSENMINATELHREELEKQEQARLCQNSQDWLTEIFDKSDVDGTGLVERREFDDMMNDDLLVDELCKASGGLRKVDLVALFDCLSSVQEDSFYIRRKDFVQGLMTHSEAPGVTQRDILRLEKRLLMQERLLLQMMERVNAGAIKPNRGRSPRLFSDDSVDPSKDRVEEERPLPSSQRRMEVSKSLADAEPKSPVPIKRKHSVTKTARQQATGEAGAASASTEESDRRSSGAAKVLPGRARGDEFDPHSSLGSTDSTPRTPKARAQPSYLRADSGEMPPSSLGSSAASSSFAPQPQVAQAIQQTGDMVQDIRWVAGQIQALNAKFLSFQHNQDEALLMIRKVQGYLLTRTTSEKVAEKGNDMCANRKSAVLAGGCNRSARNVAVKRRPTMPVVPPKPGPADWDAAAASRPTA